MKIIIDIPEEEYKAPKWECERCGKLTPYMAYFCHECAHELLGEPPKPFYPRDIATEAIAATKDRKRG